MSILIKKNNSYHLINETLYNDLRNKEIVCESSELSILNEAPSQQPVDFFVSFIPQEDRMLFATKDGKNYDEQKLNKLNDYVINKLNSGETDTNKVINDYINQLKQQPTQQEEPQSEPQTQQPTQQEEPEQNQNKTLEDYAEKLNNTYVNLMKKWNMLEDIIKLASKKDNQEYNINNIPADKLLDIAQEYKPFRNKILTTRFKNELQNLNISNTAKKEIIKLYKDGEKKGNSLRNILGSNELKNHNDKQSIYNIPVSDYYIEKYTTLKTNEIYNELTNEIYNYINNEQYKKEVDKNKDKSSGINSLISNIGIKPEHSKKTIKIALKHKYPYEALKNISLTKNNMNSEDLSNIIQEDVSGAKSDVYVLIEDLKDTLRNVGLIKFVDYLLSVKNFAPTDLLNKTEETASVVATIRLFSDFSPSSIIAELMLDDDVKKMWSVSAPRRRISAIYDKSQKIIFTSNSNKKIRFAFEFIQGFMIIDVIRNNYKKGQQIGNKILNYVKNRKGY